MYMVGTIGRESINTVHHLIPISLLKVHVRMRTVSTFKTILFSCRNLWYAHVYNRFHQRNLLLRPHSRILSSIVLRFPNVPQTTPPTNVYHRHRTIHWYLPW